MPDGVLEEVLSHDLCTGRAAAPDPPSLRVQPKVCHGGLTQPPVRYEECVAVMLDKGKIALFGIAGGGIFLMLLFALVMLYVKNRKIYREYRCLAP